MKTTRQTSLGKSVVIGLCLLTSTIYATPMVTNRTLSDGAYGTHMVPLATAVINTNGSVLEMGGGDFSTPLLHALCKMHNRLLVTVETDQSWLSLFLDLESDIHHFIYLPVFENWSSPERMYGGNPELWDQIGSDRHWGVIFIDHAPGIRRAVDIQRLRNNADIFVVHDTQAPGYCYEPVLSTFKYRFTYMRYDVTTTLVSDLIDVARLFE